MRATALLASLLVVLAITEQANHAFSYYVPRISSRLSGWGLSRGRYIGYVSQPKPERLASTKIRFSPVDKSIGVQDENSYYAGDEENILKMYEEWRNEYSKGEFYNLRYQNFRSNYIKLMTANAAELTVARDMGYPDPVPLTLNEYGDLSPEEFSNMHNGQHAPLPPSDLPYPESNNGYSQPAGSEGNEEDRIRQLYKEWCQTNGKTYDESRLPIFTTNLQVVEDYYRQTGRKAELNQFADLSPEEYQAMSAGGAVNGQSQQHNENLEHISTERQTPPSTLHQYFDETEVERIRKEYQEWCSFNGRQYDESRLEIFARNLLAIESFRVETGQNAFLNEYADMSRDEYSAIMTGGTQANNYSSNIGTAQYAMANESDPSLQNQESYFAESLSSVPPAIADQGIRAVYQDWCEYYQKPASEKCLYHFTQRYLQMEKHFIRTGEELTMDEYADMPLEGTSLELGTVDSALEEEERIREQARVEEEENERIEQARRNEQERTKAEELIRLETERKLQEEESRRQKQDEERAKFEEATKRVEEAQRLEQKQAAAAAQAALEARKASAINGAVQESLDRPATPRFSDLDAEKERLRKERIQIEESLAADRAELEEEKRREMEAKAALEETNRQIDEMTKEDEEEDDFKPDPIILPRGSYMDAVAKTWVDRTAYLKSLQEGRTGSLPSNPQYAKEGPVARFQQEEQMEIKKSESLIDNIWNFMKEYNSYDTDVTENYSENLIRQADELISDATKKSTGVVGEELRYLKKAVDAMRSRNYDDMAADRARVEANEWEEIQKGLEKEAKLAKKRREQDERKAEEARRRARSLQSEHRQHQRKAEEARRQEKALREQNRQTADRIRRLDRASENNSEGLGNLFSFFSNPFEGGTNTENIFSFFAPKQNDKDRNSEPEPMSSMTQAVKVEKKESWLDAVFGFFAADAPVEDVPGLGTITLEPAPRTSMFDLFVSPESIAPAREPGRGSITIDETQESSIFSFFAKFGISKTKEKDIDPARQKRVMDYERKLKSRQDKLSMLKERRSRILGEKDKKLSRKEARKLQRELDSLAAGNPPSSEHSDLPQLAKWTRTLDGRITGWISQTGGRYKMGTKITTSPIQGNLAKPGMTVTTVSGSKYRLGMSAAREAREAASDSVNNRQRSERRSPSPIGSFFGGLFSEETLPSLVEWVQNEDDTITGFVNNKDGFEDGTQITTSPVQRGARKGMIIQTRGGSKYKLMRQKRININTAASPSSNDDPNQMWY